MIKIRVPATTANIGPGFDSFGIALNLYNEIEIEEINGETQLLQENKPSEFSLENNLIYTSLIKILNKYNYKHKGFLINIKKCDVPISRGLGSSATCIIAGIAAANKLIGNKMTLEDIINAATEIEGHADNIAPAILGGMVISLLDKKQVIYSKINVPKNLRFVTMFPDFTVSTADARKVLPNNYSKDDCLFNISRASMLATIMNNCELNKLRICLNDKIHQPYRKKFIKNIDEIFNECKKLGSLGEFISGSGSTLISLIEDDNEKFINKLNKFLSNKEGNWKVHLLKADTDGFKIL